MLQRNQEATFRTLSWHLLYFYLAIKPSVLMTTNNFQILSFNIFLISRYLCLLSAIEVFIGTVISIVTLISICRYVFFSDVLLAHIWPSRTYFSATCGTYRGCLRASMVLNLGTENSR